MHLSACTTHQVGSQGEPGRPMSDQLVPVFRLETANKATAFYEYIGNTVRSGQPNSQVS